MGDFGEEADCAGGLLVSSFLLYHPGIPLVPGVVPAHSQESVQCLLPSRRVRMHWARAPTICVFEVLQRSPVGRIVVPHGQLEQYRTERKLDLMRPVLLNMGL